VPDKEGTRAGAKQIFGEIVYSTQKEEPRDNQQSDLPPGLLARR